MAFIDTPQINKIKTLKDNRNQIIDLIFREPLKYLEENIFENLCNNLDLSDNDVDNILIECLNFLELDIDEIYYLENEILIGEEDHKGQTSNTMPEIVTEPSNIENYLRNRGIPSSSEKYNEVERIFKAKTKLEKWKTLPESKDLLVLNLQGHKPEDWKQVFHEWKGNLLRHSMEALSVIVDLNYKLIYLESTLGYNEKQLYIGWRDWMKNNNLDEFNEFDTNITVISFIDLIGKLVLGVGIDEKDDVVKQIKAIRSLEQLKICDL